MLGLGLSLIKGAGKNVGAFLSYIKDSLKLYYRFYDNSPELLLSGATSFDGSDDYIDTGITPRALIGNSNPFTVSAWAKANDDDNEYIGAKIAQNYLRTTLFPKNQIEIIERLILATKPSYTTPIDILEKIIKDADLDNL